MKVEIYEKYIILQQKKIQEAKFCLLGAKKVKLINAGEFFALSVRKSLMHHYESDLFLCTNEQWLKFL